MGSVAFLAQEPEHNWTFMGKVLVLFFSSFVLLFLFGLELTKYILI